MFFSEMLEFPKKNFTFVMLNEKNEDLLLVF